MDAKDVNTDPDFSKMDELLPKYTKIRQDNQTAEEFGNYLKKTSNDEWSPVLLEIIAFVCDLDWIPTTKVYKEDSYTENEYEIIMAWCDENCRGKWLKWSDACFVFELEDDAVLFKLACF